MNYFKKTYFALHLFLQQDTFQHVHMLLSDKRNFLLNTKLHINGFPEKSYSQS